MLDYIHNNIQIKTLSTTHLLQHTYIARSVCNINGRDNDQYNTKNGKTDASSSEAPKWAFRQPRYDIGSYNNGGFHCGNTIVDM